MRMEVDYTVLKEKFNFSGYAHSFYSPHFSVNLTKNPKSISISFNIYPKKIKLNYLKCYVKLPSGYSFLSVNGTSIFPYFESQVLLESGDEFLMFVSTDEQKGITTFNLDKGSILVEKKFNGNIFYHGENKILSLEQYSGSLPDVLKKYYNILQVTKKSNRISSWINLNLARKSQYDFKKSINDLARSNFNVDYFFINDPKSNFVNLNFVDEAKSALLNSATIPAVSISPFLISRSCNFFGKFEKYFLNIDGKAISVDGKYVLDPKNEDFKNHLKKYLFDLIDLGVELIQFDDLLPLMYIKDLKWSVNDLINDIIDSIKSLFPSVKIITDLPYRHFPSNKVNFIKLNFSIEQHGSIFKSYKLDYRKLIFNVFFDLLNSQFSNIYFPFIGFGLTSLSEQDRYFISIISYIFSDMLGFSTNFSDYSREEIAISKKMLHIQPTITDLYYKEGLFKLSIYTDDLFTVYINFNKSKFTIDSIQLSPLSIQIFDSENLPHKWPFSGW